IVYHPEKRPCPVISPARHLHLSKDAYPVLSYAANDRPKRLSLSRRHPPRRFDQTRGHALWVSGRTSARRLAIEARLLLKNNRSRQRHLETELGLQAAARRLESGDPHSRLPTGNQEKAHEPPSR